MNIDEIHRSLKELDFIDSFSVKKIYPNTIKIKVIDK